MNLDECRERIDITTADARDAAMTLGVQLAAFAMTVARMPSPRAVEVAQSALVDMHDLLQMVELRDEYVRELDRQVLS